MPIPKRCQTRCRAVQAKDTRVRDGFALGGGTLEWYVLNDVVMGGQSSSALAAAAGLDEGLPPLCLSLLVRMENACRETNGGDE